MATTPQGNAIFARYGVTTQRDLIKAIRDEYQRETDERPTAAAAQTLLEQMMEAEFERQQAETAAPTPDEMARLTEPVAKKVRKPRPARKPADGDEGPQALKDLLTLGSAKRTRKPRPTKAA